MSQVCHYQNESKRRQTAKRREIVGREYLWRGEHAVVIDVIHDGRQRAPHVLVRLSSTGAELWTHVAGLRRLNHSWVRGNR